MNRITRRVGAICLALCTTALLASAPATASTATESEQPLPADFVSICLLPFTNVIIGTPHADVLVGTWQNDLIIGLGGDDQLYGHGGRDSMYGGAGRDLLMGEEGDDCIIGGAERDTSIRYTFVDHGTDDVRDVEARYEY